MKRILLTLVLFECGLLHGQVHLLASVHGQAGFSRASSVASGNNALSLKPLFPQAGRGLGGSIGVGFQRFYVSLGFSTFQFSSGFTDVQLAGSPQQIQFSHRVSARQVCLGAGYYVGWGERFQMYAAARLSYLHGLRPDSQNALFVAMPGAIYTNQWHPGLPSLLFTPETGLSFRVGQGSRIEAGLCYRIGTGNLLAGSYVTRSSLTGLPMNVTNYSMSATGPGFVVRLTKEIAELKKPKRAKDTLHLQAGIALNSQNIPETVFGRPVEKQGNIKLNQPFVDIYVKDGGTADGDSVSLCLNGVWLLENYLLTAEKKVLRIHLLPDQNNYLVLYALNLGKQPPNTVAISYRDGLREVKLHLKSTLGKCGAVNLLYDSPE